MSTDSAGSLAWWGVLWSAIAAIGAAFAAVAASIAAWAASKSLTFLRRQTNDLALQLSEAQKDRKKAAEERIELIEFSMTPVVALEGGAMTSLDNGYSRADWKIHLHGEGFAYNLIVNFFVASPPGQGILNLPSIAVFKFSRAPGEYDGHVNLPVAIMAAAGDLSVRVEARFENAFKQEVRFKQSGFVRIETQILDFNSGAPEYAWPWKSIQPKG